MKRLSICWIIGCLLELVACRPEVPTQAEQGSYCTGQYGPSQFQVG